MKFSSPANIALATIALSSPNLLSSPAFVHAAPTMETASLSPNPGTGYLGNSAHLSSTESPVLQAAGAIAGTPPARKIAGRRRSLRRANLAKNPSKGDLNRFEAANGDALGLGVKHYDALGLEVPGTSQRVAMPSSSGLGHVPVPTTASEHWVQPNDILGMIPRPGSAMPAVPGIIPLSAPGASVPKPADVVQGVQGPAQTITTPTLNSMSGHLPDFEPNLRVPRDLLPERLVGKLLNIASQHDLPSVVNPNGAPVLEKVISALPELPAPALVVVSAAKGAIIPARPRAVLDSPVPLDPLPTLATPLPAAGGQLLNTGLLAPPNSPILGANGVLQSVGPMGSIPVVDQLGSLPYLEPTAVDALLPPAAIPALPTGTVVPEASELSVPGANGLPAIPGVNNLPTIPSGGGLPAIPGKNSLPAVPGAIGLPLVSGATGVTNDLLASTVPSVGLPIPGVAVPDVSGLPVNTNFETGLPVINSLPISASTGSVPAPTVPSGIPIDPLKMVPTSVAPRPGASGIPNPLSLDSHLVVPPGHGPIEDIGEDAEARVPVTKRAVAEPTLPTVVVTDVDAEKQLQSKPEQPEPTTERGNATNELPVGAEAEESPVKLPGFRYQIGDWDGDEYDDLNEDIPRDTVNTGQEEKEAQTSSSAGFAGSTTPTMTPTRTMMAVVDATETAVVATKDLLAVAGDPQAATRTDREAPVPVSVTPLPTRMRTTKDAKPTTATYRWGTGPQRRAWMSRRRLGLASPSLADEAGPLPADATGIPTVVTQSLPTFETGALATATPAVGTPLSAARPVSQVAQLATESIPVPTSNFGSPALALLSPPSGSPALSAIQQGSFVPESGSLLPTPLVYLPRSASLVTLRSVSMVSIVTSSPSEPLDTATAISVPVETASATTSEIGTQVAPSQTWSVRPTQTSYVVPTQAALHRSSPGHQTNPTGLGSSLSFDSISSGSDASTGPTAIVLSKPTTSQSTLPPETHATGTPLSRVNERSHTLSGPSRLRTLMRSVVTPTSSVAITDKDSDTPTSTGSVPSPTGSGTGTHAASSDMGATRSIFRLRVPSAVTSTVRPVVTGRKSRS